MLPGAGQFKDDDVPPGAKPFTSEAALNEAMVLYLLKGTYVPYESVNLPLILDLSMRYLSPE